MALVNYKDIDFNKSINKENKIIDFNGSIIEVIQYLSAQDKYDLIIATLQKADEADLYNSFKTKFYFDLNLAMMYSNIAVTEEDKEDEIQFYDNLKHSGLLDLIIEAIPENEKNELWNHITKIQKEMSDYRRSASSMVNTVFEKGPLLVDKIKELLSSLDEDKIQLIAKMFVDKDIKI